MRIIKNLAEMRGFSLKAKARHKTIGFVPTMGYLHEGHLSLVEAARNKADLVVVSIFVNPLQFGPGEDHTRYPRNLKHDKKLLQNIQVDVLFVPNAKELFPAGHKTFVEVAGLSHKLCGRTRPGHFRGVTTVVTTLFNLVCPDFACFGDKDYQQQVIIKTLVRDLRLPVEIISLPIVREFDGLAMSSRNSYLTVKERQAAPVLYKALCLAKEEITTGCKDIHKILLRMRALIGSVPSIRLDYVVLADPVTLEEKKSIQGPILIALAAHLGQARLIDNLLVQA